MPNPSEPSRPATRHLAVFLWTVVLLAAIDIAIGTTIRTPADPRVQPSSLQQYFDFGRTVEGKLRAMVKPEDEKSSPIVVAGWIDSECHRTVPKTAGTLGISIYGNSFSGQLSDALRKLDPNLAIEEYLGPGAPPSHSYACFVKENSFGGDSHEIQIIGITTSSLPRMEQIWGVTTSFEYPQPFTFPRYQLGPDGSLISHEPSVRSPNDLRRILADKASWNNWLSELKTNDYFYVPVLTTEDPADKSVIGRLARRAIGQYINRKRISKLRNQEGKFVAPGIADVLPKLISNYAQLARQSGKRPVVVLFEEYGYDNVLMPLLSHTLQENHIEYVYSRDIAPANDLRNYASDGHFSPSTNMRIATAVLKLINNRQPSDASSSGAQIIP